MADIQHEIELLQIEIQQANEVIAKAVRDRKAVAKDSPMVAELNAAVTAARQALHLVEVKLRTQYEAKDD